MPSVASQVGVGLMTVGFTGVFIDVLRKASTRAHLRRRASAIAGGLMALGLAFSLFAYIPARNTLYAAAFTYLLLILALTATRVIRTAPDAR